MSLINDALKRAREANEERGTATPPLKPLDPVDSASPPESNTPWVLIAITTLIALLSLFFLWQWSQQTDSGPLLAEVADRDQHTTPVVATDSEPPPANPETLRTEQTGAGAGSTDTAERPPTTPSLPIAERTPSPVAPAPEQPVPLAPSASEPFDSVSPSEVTPNPPPAMRAKPEPVVPPEREFKLQSVIYRLKNPAVLINGKFLELGESINGAVVIDIQRSAATLRRNATNIALSLPPI